MLGRATAALESPARRLPRRILGSLDVHSRQKWLALEPFLREVPRSLRLLDAGCGTGRWTLELAARHAGWSLVGIDRDANVLEIAERDRRRLGLRNVAFRQSDFLAFRPEATFDLVLSVSSAHYLAEEGKGADLFRHFRAWLSPGGRLLLLGPRRWHEAPFARWLPHPPWHDVFSAEELAGLCRHGGLQIELLRPTVGRLGTMAKQLDWMAHGFARIFGVGLSPMQWALASLDARRTFRAEQPTLMWLLVAHAVCEERCQ